MNLEEAYQRYIAYLEGVICATVDNAIWERVGVERSAIFNSVEDYDIFKYYKCYFDELDNSYKIVFPIEEDEEY